MGCSLLFSSFQSFAVILCRRKGVGIKTLDVGSDQKLNRLEMEASFSCHRPGKEMEER